MRRTDVVAAPARRLDPVSAVALDEAEDAEAGAEALLGMRLAPCMIASNSATVAGPIVAASPMHPRRRPFGVAPMRARHVLGDRRVPVAHGRERMARDPRAPVEDLDRGAVMRASTSRGSAATAPSR